MTEENPSCLIEKLAHYIDLDETARRHLAALEKEEQTFERHEDIVTEHDELLNMHVVKSGWLYSYMDLQDGRRQIVRVLHPGDIVGFPDIAFDSATCSIRAAEDVCLCPFPKKDLDLIFQESPRLTALLFTLANRELAAMIDSLRAVGRMSARERLSYFLLDLAARLRVTNKHITDTFRLPLNQTEIGDALGLTHTYVSKTMREMEDEGVIARAAGRITLLDEDAMRAEVDFADRYASLDTDWFPDR